MIKGSFILLRTSIFALMALCLSINGFSQSGDPFSGSLPPNVIHNIDAIEYFFDYDPGFGNGYPISMSPGNEVQLQNIQLAGTDTLAPGVHQLYVRSRNNAGMWSVSNHALFLIVSPFINIPVEQASHITYAEYFFDMDPGFGNGTAISLSAGADVALNNLVITGLDTLQSGVHNFYVRFQNANGGWSTTNTTTLLILKDDFGIKPNTLSNIINAEYFFDADPGFGNGTAISLAPGADIALNNLVITGLDTLQSGVHNFYLRFQNANGGWSITNTTTLLMLADAFGIKPNTLSNIINAEYFFDADPGFGNGTAISLSAGADVALNNLVITGMDTLQTGVHNFYVRFQNANGGWSITNTTTLLILKDEFGIKADTLSNIVKAEYFFDTDPGFGNGINIPLGPGPNVVLDNVVISGIDGLSNGIHKFYIRLQDARGGWSLTNAAAIFFSSPDFSISPNPSPSNIIEIEYYIDADPGIGNGIQVPAGGNPDVAGLAFDVDMTGVTEGNHTLYIRAKDENGAWSIRVIEPFTVHQPVPEDIQVISTNLQDGECLLTAETTVQVTLLNGGDNPVSGFDIVYQINDSIVVTETVTEEIVPAEEWVYTFSQKADISAIGAYDIIVYTLLAGDDRPENDTLNKIIQHHAPIEKGVSPDITICNGNAINLSAFGGVTYAWSNGNTSPILNATPTTDTTFYVTITDEYDCTRFDSVVVTVLPALQAPVISVLGDAQVCFGDSIVLTTDFNAPVEWFKIEGGENIPLQNAENLTVTQPGEYFAIYKNAGGCEVSSAPYQANILPKPTLTTMPSVAAICNGDSVIIEVVDANVFNWSTGETTSSINVSPQDTTTYYVTGTNSLGCTYSDSVTIEVLPAQAPGQVGNLFPEDMSLDIDRTAEVSWSPAENATAYDLYVWKAIENKPAFATQSDITELSARISSLQSGTTYKWSITAKNSCFQTAGPILNFTTGSLPDLIINGYQTTDNTTGGSKITVEYEVKNIGAGGTNTQQWKDRIWLSPDQDLRRADDILLAEFDNLSYLQPGESYVQTKVVDIPQHLAGTYYLFIITDNDDAYCVGGILQNGECAGERNAHNQGMAESDEQNNFVYPVITINHPPLPDLVVKSVGAPTDVFSNDDIPIQYLVKNEGDFEAKSVLYDALLLNGIFIKKYYWKDAIYISADSVFDIYTAKKLKEPKVMLGYVNFSTYQFVNGALQIDSSYTRSDTVHIPEEYQGTYYLYVVANNIGVFEPSYFNNILRSAPITVRLTPPADLIGASINAPANANAGEQISLDFTVLNQGANPPTAGNWIDKIYLSKVDSFNESSAFLIGTKSFSGSAGDLTTGSGYTVSGDYDVPRDLLGSYFVYVITDADNQVFEYDKESNNIFRSTLPVTISIGNLPDLVVSSITLPDSLTRGRQFPIKWTINNNGAEQATGSWVDRIYWSSNKDFNAGSPKVLGISSFTGTLDIGITYDRTKMVNLPENAPDSITFFVFTDYEDQLFEESETNNITSHHQLGVATPVIVTLPPAPVTPENYIDLAAASLTANSSAMSGSNLEITYTINNLTAFDSRVGWVDGLYLSDDGVLSTDDYQLKLDNIQSIAGNGSYSETPVVLIPDGFSGNYYLILYTDIHNTAMDTLSGNNSVSRAISITLTPPPDLFVSAMSAPAEIYPGQSLVIPYTTGNQGTGAATGVWYDAVYLSRSPELNGSKILVGQHGHTGPLETGQNYVGSIPVQIPANVFGNYYLIVKTDFTQVVYEYGQEDNNGMAGVVAVVLPGAADLIITELTLPDTAYLGDLITTNYKVKNIGDNPTVIPFNDAVYLSGDLTFDALSDYLLGTIPRENLLQPGEAKFYTIDGRVNSVFPGDYSGVGRTNVTGAVIEDNLDNNFKFSDQKIHVRVKDLQLDVPENVYIDKDEYAYYKIEVGPDLDLVVELTGIISNIQNEIYIAFNRVPTVNDFDAKGNVPQQPDQRLIIPGTQSGAYYILVKTNRDSAQSLTLLARTLPFSLYSATPQTLGQGRVSIRVEGAGFRSGIQFRLRKTGMSTDAASPTQATLENSMEAGLSWDLTLVPTGEYDLVAINPDASEVKLIKGITIEESTGYQLFYDVLAPEVLRVGKSGSYDFIIKNTGNVDIPFVQTSISVADFINIVKVQTKGNVQTREQMNPGIDSTHFLEYFIFQNFKVIPLHTRDLVAGDEFRISVLFANFKKSNFSASVIAKALDKEEFMAKQLSAIELMRNIALYNPDYFADNELEQAAQGKEQFTRLLLGTYIQMGVIAASDTIGVTPCEACGIPDGDQAGFIYSPGRSPGYILLPFTDFGKNQYYKWEINNYLGFAGSWNGWDLIETQGPINIKATPEQPFTIQIVSLDFFNRPGYLGAFAPGYDKCFPIAIANGGIQGFNKDKFEIDASAFVRYNKTYGGIFSVELHGTDTIMLCFTARVPGPGEYGIPGGPGGYGQDGAPGGPGGPGNDSTSAGEGGPGGAGGLGDVYRAPGEGGPGGDGGENTDGTHEDDGPPGPEGLEYPEDFPPGVPPPPPGTPPGTPPATPPAGPPPPGVPPDTPPVIPPGGEVPPGMEPGAPPPPPPPVIPPGGTPGGSPNIPPAGGCGAPPPSLGQWAACQGVPWMVGCGITAYGCYALFISGGAKIGVVGGLAGVVVGATGGALVAAYFCGSGIGTCAQGNLTLPGKALKYVICRPVVGSCDPNEIQGPLGYGAERFVSNTARLPYTILYENDPEFASAPAQKVAISLPIDKNLNPSTVRIGSFSFGDYLFTVPGGLSNYTTTLDFADSLGYYVNVTAGLDVVNREIIWIFQTIDPNTGLPPQDPFSGFLPINDSTGQGEGFVSYTIQALETTHTGDSIQAKGEIVFDINAPIFTNTALNIIDAVAPVSGITNQVSVSYNSVINLSVEATDDDGGSGVKEFVLYYSENGAPFVQFDSVYTNYDISFVGNPGSDYCFFTRAIDNVENWEPIKDGCEVFVRLASPLGVTWLYFTGELSDDAVILHWATATESNSKLFVIERSLDGITFIELGRLEAGGNTMLPATYQYKDPDVLGLSAQVLYYRLKQIDADGKYTYSKIVAIPIGNDYFEPIVKASPNPFKTTTTVTMITKEAPSATDRIQLFTIQGRLLYERSVAGRLSKDHIKLNNLPKLPAGVYLLKVILNGKATFIKLVRE